LKVPLAISINHIKQPTGGRWSGREDSPLRPAPQAEAAQTPDKVSI
jgi:hypothetical protein